MPWVCTCISPRRIFRFLIDNDEREVERIVRCYDRAQRWAHTCADCGRLHVSFSGILAGR